MRGERILIDTSVWITYFKEADRKSSGRVDEVLNHSHIFVPKVVIAELTQGAKSEKEIKVIEEFINAFNIIDQKENTWEKAGKLSFLMKRKGITINLVDCYIAVLAYENNCKVFTLDEHFQSIKKFLGIELVE